MFLVQSGIDAVMKRPGTEFSDPPPATGAKDITGALNRRRDNMRIGIDHLRNKLGQEVPQLVNRFDPGKATRDMLSRMDIFKLQRVVNGHQALRDDGERGGVRGLLAVAAERAGGTSRLRGRAAGSSAAEGQDVPQGPVLRRARRAGPQPAGRLVPVANARGVGQHVGHPHAAVEPPA